jgi:hypothetical protein
MGMKCTFMGKIWYGPRWPRLVMWPMGPLFVCTCVYLNFLFIWSNKITMENCIFGCWSIYRVTAAFNFMNNKNVDNNMVYKVLLTWYQRYSLFHTCILYVHHRGWRKLPLISLIERTCRCYCPMVVCERTCRCYCPMVVCCIKQKRTLLVAVCMFYAKPDISGMSSDLIW